MSREIEAICDEARECLDRSDAAVDIIGIAKKERIELAAGSYGAGFHGRIEYLRPVKRFALYHPEFVDRPSAVRIRFSIAHELGHYFLPSHRERLLLGHSHDSQPGFKSEKAMEREADEFAAALLIPRGVLEERIRKKRFMTLQEIAILADDLNVSLPAAVIRYVRYTEEPCAVVFSEGNKVLYAIASDEMKAVGLGFIRRGADLPPKSKGRVLSQAVRRERLEGPTMSDEWFDGRLETVGLWEEAISLGYHQQVISLVSVQNENA